MEAIKCPNCGSEKVQELTEEKYVCLACDNIFLVHNLSKEFQQTDEHISDIHQDLGAKLDNLSKNMTTISKTSSVDNTRVKEILFEAEENLANGNYSDAYVGFKKYANLMPNSYVGYEGMYRTISCTNVIRNENDLYNGFDVLKKALACEDCDKKELLKPILKEHQSAIDEMFYNKITEKVNKACSNADLPQTDLAQDIQQLITFHEDEKKKKEEAIERIRITNQAVVQAYNNLSEKEREKKRKDSFKKAFLPPIILLLVSIFVLNGFLRVVFILVSLIWAFVAEVLRPHAPVELGDDFFVERRKQIDGEQEQVDYWKNELEILNSRTDLQISDMEQIICNEWDRGCSAEKFYQDWAETARRIEEEEQRKLELLEGYYYVTLTNWGNRPSEVKDILMEYCSSSDWVIDNYRNRTECTINNFKKERAYELQDKLVKCGAFSFVRKM